jgi:predicted permease
LKDTLRRIFSSLLNPLEQADGEFAYKPSHRIILLVVGVLFLCLSLGVLAAVVVSSQYGAGLPCLIFFAVAFYCLVVGSLGSDKAVAKLWNSRH